MDKLRVFVTSVGSLVATNFFEALQALGRERFFVIGTNSVAEAANNFACDVVYRVPLTASGDAFRDALADIGRCEQPDLWLPSRDDDVLELAKLAAVRRLPGRVLVGSVDAARIVCDKWLSYCFAMERNLRVAPSAASIEEGQRLAETHGYPLLGKPRRGFGSRGVRFLFDESQLRAAMALDDFFVQVPISLAPDWRAQLPDFGLGVPLWYSYEDPEQYASQWLVAQDGAAIEIGASLNLMRSGRNERSVRVDDPALSQTAGDYARALAEIGWRGPLNVQCRRSVQGEYFMFELAGRIAGGLGGRELVGIPETRIMLAALFPARFPQPLVEPTDGVIAIKQPLTVAIEAGNLETFGREGVWRRSL